MRVIWSFISLELFHMYDGFSVATTHTSVSEWATEQVGHLCPVRAAAETWAHFSMDRVGNCVDRGCKCCRQPGLRTIAFISQRSSRSDQWRKRHCLLLSSSYPPQFPRGHPRSTDPTPQRAAFVNRLERWWLGPGSIHMAPDDNTSSREKKKKDKRFSTDGSVYKPAELLGTAPAAVYSWCSV